MKVAVVDDSLALAETLADGLVDQGIEAIALGSGRAALELLARREVDILVTDLRMPDLDGLALVEAARANDVPAIVMTAYGAIDSAIECIRKGAYHYLTKPFKLDELVIFVRRAEGERALRRETAELRKSLGLQFSTTTVIAHSAAMQRVLELAQRIAGTDATVLLSGETGTGKTMIARALHGESARTKAPFVAINCAALPEALLESELFGHVKGAFTGAVADHAGLFASAAGGTVLLDEIGEMPIGLQAKLLRVIETGSIRPVGATREKAIDVRVIAATHRDLRRAVTAGTFREDLLYRLDVVAIEVPPLRHRKDDIAPLAERFLAEARRRHPSAPGTHLSRAAMTRLLDHPWPGNVRELAHVVERGVLLAGGAEIAEPDLGLVAPAQVDAAWSGAVQPMIEIQRRYARWALDQLNGHKTRTADQLDVDVKTLNRWLAGDDS